MKRIVSALAAWSDRAPWLIIATSLVVAGVLGYFAGQIEIASGNEGFAPESAEISAQEEIGSLFGEESSESTVQVILRNEGGDVITAEGLRTVREAVAAIESSDLGDNISQRADRPGIFHYLSGVDQAIAAEGIPEEAINDQLVKEFFAASLDPQFSSPEQVSFLSRLVSGDFDESSMSASGGMVLAFVSGFDGADGEEAFLNQSAAEVNMADALSTLESELDVLPFSFGLLVSGTDDFNQEVGQLFGLAFLVILIILLFVYWLWPGKGGSALGSVRRTVADMLLTLVTILIAIGMMQGLGYLLEQAGIIDAFSPPTQIVPILMIGLGVDYAIHLTSRYREEVGEGLGVDGAMSGAVKSVGVALFLATITTVIGFLTNVFNPVPALKDFGILAAVGIVVAFILMLTFVPAVRRVLDRRAEAKGALPVSSLESHGDRLLPRLMERLSILAEHAATPTIIIALLLGVAGFWGFTQLETRFSFTDFLPDDSPYVETLNVLADDFGGGFGEQTQVLIKPGDGKAIDGEIHNALVDANNSLTSLDDVSTIDTPGGSFPNAASIVGVLGQALQGGPTATPPEILAAAQAAGLGQDLKVSPDANVAELYQAVADSLPEQAARVAVLDGGEIKALLWDITTTAGEEVSDLIVGLDEAFEPVNAAGATAIDTSDNIIGDVVVRSLTESQSASLFITIAVAALVLMISFYLESRRWALGLITIAPVALVVLWTYGLMYASGIPFGPVTATIAALAIGIGVPFTIHIARRFQDDRKNFADMDDAMRSTMRHTGGALAGSAFTTMAGFGVLMTSSLTPFRQMGQVTVYAIGLSLAAAVLVLPSLLALWDGWHRKRGDAVVNSEATQGA